MAITGYGLQGTTTDAGEMMRFAQAMVNFKVLEPGHLDVRPLGTLTRGVEVSAGAATSCGVRVDVTQPVRLSLEPNPTSSDRYDTIMLVTSWSGTIGGSTARIEVRNGGATPPTPAFTLAALQECPLATVRVGPSATRFNASDINKIAPYGDSSELQILGSKPDGMRVPVGTRIRCGANGDLYQATAQTTFKALKRTASPWQTFTPVVNSTAGQVYLGNGGVSKGRYKIVNGYCIAEFEMRSGTDAYNWGYGDLWFTLPYPMGGDNAPNDQWFAMHMYTTTGDGLMDWLIQAILQKGSSKALLFGPRSAVDCRTGPLMAADSAARNPETGRPWIKGGVTDPSVISGTFRYPV